MNIYINLFELYKIHSKAKSRHFVYPNLTNFTIFCLLGSKLRQHYTNEDILYETVKRCQIQCTLHQHNISFFKYCLITLQPFYLTIFTLIQKSRLHKMKVFTENFNPLKYQEYSFLIIRTCIVMRLFQIWYNVH